MKRRHPVKGQIELGLAVSRLSLSPGEIRTQKQLADFCGVTHKTIQNIEKSALAKCRRQLTAIIGTDRIAL